MTKSFNISNNELKEFHRIDGVKNTLAICLDYLLVFSIFFAAIKLNSLILFPVFMILMARTQLALFVLSHDAVHLRLYNNRKLNDFIGHAISLPMFFLFNTYRDNHLKHHQNPHHPEDPNNPISGNFPMEKSKFYKMLLCDLLGITYVQLLISLTRKDNIFAISEKNKNEFHLTMFFGTIINCALAGLLFYLGHGLVFLLLWWIPMVTILQALMRIRTVMEHGGLLENEDQSNNSRTVVNPIQTFIFGPHGVNYHIEHHLFPAVPWHQLKNLHKKIKAEIPSENVYSSYSQVFDQILNKGNSNELTK